MKFVVGKEGCGVKTVFDSVSPRPSTLLQQGAVRGVLQKIVPFDVFSSFDENFEDGGVFDSFLESLPMIQSVDWGEGVSRVSIYLLSFRRMDVAKFFYDVGSRYLLPGKKLRISFFSGVDFQLSRWPQEMFTLCEMVVTLQNEEELDLVRSQLGILEGEIRLGLNSVYHANRILEIQGLSIDEKTLLIQEKLFSFLKKRPKDFDYDIFVHAQRFLLKCDEEFKIAHDCKGLTRMICVTYLMKQRLSRFIEESESRIVDVKLVRMSLALPLGVKQVVGVFVGVSFQGENELFDQKHLKKVIESRFAHLRVVQGSFFSMDSREEKIALLYLEVEKKDQRGFVGEEINKFKRELIFEVQNGVEKVAHPLFITRNEEEVMRNIITLSNQLRFSKDLPQAILSFDDQTEWEVCFTVIWLRLLKGGERSVQDLLLSSPFGLKFSLDRIRCVGSLRKRFTKEATVFRVKIPIAPFLRPDHSLDIFQARQTLLVQLKTVLGEFRDFNGGMIAKQHEQLLLLKELVGPRGRKEELLVESFFHAIFPIELRSVFPVELLKNLFNILFERIEKEGDEKFVKLVDDSCAYVLQPFASVFHKEAFNAYWEQPGIPSSQRLKLSLSLYGSLFLGAVYREEDLQKKVVWINLIEDLLKT